MMEYKSGDIEKLSEEYGLPLYVFDKKGFIENYHHLEGAFRKIYPKYQIAYSLKTNYAPYIVSVVRQLGGYAEVVSGMEYHIAKRLGFPDRQIIFNGPDKGADGIEAFLNGCRLQIDNLDEAWRVAKAALADVERKFEVALRINPDVGQSFVSRFGLDPGDIETAMGILSRPGNVAVTGLHCHISRCRGLDAWKSRITQMLRYADEFFSKPLRYINLGSGMYGSMDPEFAAQFSDVPTYEEYADVVAGAMAEHYADLPDEEKPLLITEPGTTLVNRFVDLVARVDAVKTIRGRRFAVMNCSEHNLGEICTLEELPMRIIPAADEREDYDSVDFVGYTCLEQDVMRRGVSARLGVGDYVAFGNVGGYSNVLKPPFIAPNCAMIARDEKGGTVLMKRKENYDDILHTYVF